MGNRLTIEELQTGTELFFPNFLEGFRERVNQYYSEEYSNSPNFFSLTNSCFLTAIHFKFDSYYIFTASEKDTMHQIVADEDVGTGLKHLLDTAPDHIFKKSLYSFFNIDEEQILTVIRLWELDSWLTLAFRDNGENHIQIPRMSRDEGIKKADWDFAEAKLQEAIKDTIKPSVEYNNFDAEALIVKVDSESFRYEFEESIKAYNSELYLAAGATAGIAMENLLKTLIVRHLGVRALPKRTFIRDFSEVLKIHKIIDERMANRVLGFSTVRNSSSHTNTGRVSKEDVDQGYYLIKELVNFLP